jgi:hypothetical protein
LVTVLTKWGQITVALAAAGTLAVPAPGPSGGPSLTNVPQLTVKPDSGVLGGKLKQAPPEGVFADVALKIGRDGSLAVTEKVTVPGGQHALRRLPLRVPAGDDQDRVYTVRDAKVQGAGKVEPGADVLTITLDGGESTVTYTVDGAVADAGDGQQIRWQVAGGWDVKLTRVSASFIAPTREMSSVDCFAGTVGSDRQCTLAETDHTGVIRIEQDPLPQGERVDIVVKLPGGTVPANARFAGVGVGGAFALTTAATIGFGVLALLLILGALVVVLLRRRDKRALATDVAPVDVLLREGGHVTFASPDGVLPGQVGTVVDESVDVVDVSGTVIDLAVRNYLWLAEIRDPGGVLDWRIARRNPPDEHLAEFEKAIYQAILPDGADAVLLSELRGRGRLDLRAVREAMYDDVVAKRWFSRRPGRRGPLTWVGAGVALIGVLGTVALAFTGGPALLGVAVVVAGAALAFGAAWLPPRTTRGRVLVGQVRGLLAYLHTVRPGDIPDGDRELVFSRSLPYAVVLGGVELWLEKFAALDPAADGSAGLYWFGGLEQDRDLRRFATHLPALLAALDGLLAQSGHLRSTRPEPVAV